jgi:hypothetical protein
MKELIIRIVGMCALIGIATILFACVMALNKNEAEIETIPKTFDGQLNDIPAPVSPEPETLSKDFELGARTVTTKPKVADVVRTTGDGIDWLIMRESGGDTYAENGKYKGIGQLDESYYPRFVGKTWEECKGDWDIQFEAMMIYIYGRYGSVDGAVRHFKKVGWY